MCEADPDCPCGDDDFEDEDLCEWCGAEPGSIVFICEECEREREYHKTTQEELKKAQAVIQRLKAAMAVVAENGGDTTEEGLSMNGRWCREQMRQALEGL